MVIEFSLLVNAREAILASGRDAVTRREEQVKEREI